MSTSEFPVGTELVFAENREIEQNNKLDKSTVADHVWNACRPSPKFSSSMPTVTARRIQLMRIQLQNNPRLLEVWETNVSDLYEEEEDDDNESFGRSSTEQYSGSSSKKGTSDKTSSGSDEILPAQYSSSGSKKTVSQKYVECPTEVSSPQYSKKKMSRSSSRWSENPAPSLLDGRKSISAKSSVCSTKIPSSYRSSRISKKTLSEKSSHRSNIVFPEQQSSCCSRKVSHTNEYTTDSYPADTSRECIWEDRNQRCEMHDVDVEEDYGEGKDENEYSCQEKIAEQSYECSDDDEDYEENGDLGEENEYDDNENMDQMCKFYEKGEAMGNLCKPLCTEKEIHSLTCTPQNSGKEFVFTAKWNNRLIVFKSSSGTSEASFFWNNEKLEYLDETVPKTVPRVLKPKLLRDEEGRAREVKNYKRRREGVKEISEKNFESMIQDIVADKLNVTITKSQLESLKYLEIKNKFLYSEYSEARKIEKANLYRLLQSKQYIMTHLFADREMFPRLIGTCGHFFVVEHLRSPHFNSFFMLDEKEEWSDRMKLAIEIMDFVEELETNFPDALHLCDIKMDHFGMTNTGRLKYLSLDSVYTNNVIERLLANGKPCQENEDCDLLDCKSLCNAKTKICDSGVANNNIQVICEKIFIGWTMAGKLIVPGLLMSEHTPASLATLLRLCAENGRGPVPEDIRQKLYTTLTEMYQILTQRLSV